RGPLCQTASGRTCLPAREKYRPFGHQAPEILHYEPITLAADMWSLGVTTYVLLTGFSPFGGETDQETFQNISLGEVDFPEELFEDVSAQAKDFVAKLLVLNPSTRMTAKQCMRHEWLRGAPTQASPHLRRYLSKSREVLLERVVSRENLRRAALLSQASSNANLSEPDQNQGLNCNLSQSEMCLSYGLTGSRGSLAGSEGYMSPADSQTSLNSSQTSLAMSQSCLLNKEQTQGLLTQAQSKSQANLNLGASRGLLSRMRSMNQIQSQACLLKGNKGSGKEILSPLFGRSREKLYGLKSLSKSQGVLDIYRSLECLRQRKKNQRAQTEDILPIFKQLSTQIAASNASLVSSCDMDNNKKNTFALQNSGATFVSLMNTNSGSVETPCVHGAKSSETKITGIAKVLDKSGDNFKRPEAQGSIIHCKEEIKEAEVRSMQREIIRDRRDSERKSERKLHDVPKSLTSGSEENLDSLQSTESDTLTEDSDETAPDRNSLTVKQPCHRQHSDLSNHSNISANSDDKDDHSDCENDEPKYSVAQLVSAFNKHQEVASKTSLEAIMTEKRVNEVTFPTGHRALRLFIPDINITERGIIRRKTSYKPRKNWEELRKRSEKNEGIFKDFDNDSGNEYDEEEFDGSESSQGHKEGKTEEETTLMEIKTSHDQHSENQKNDQRFYLADNEKMDQDFRQDWSTFDSNQVRITIDGPSFLEEPAVQSNLDTRIDQKYKQCVDGVKATKSMKTDKMEKADNLVKTDKLEKIEKVEKTEQIEMADKSPKTTRTKANSLSYQKERVANYIFPELQTTSRSKKDECDKVYSKSTPKVITDSSVNLKDILQKVDNFQTTPKENLENLRKRTSIAKIILNDNLILDSDTNNNGTNSPTNSRLRFETPSCLEEDNAALEVPPSFVRSSSLSSDGSCPTPSSAQTDIGMSWEDVDANRGSSTSLEKEESRPAQKRSQSLRADIQKPEISKQEGKSRSNANLHDRKVWGKVCTGSYTRAMEKFNGKSAEANRKGSLFSSSHQTEKIRRKSTPVMPQLIDP
ncbi:uncharacterized protein LOC117174579, partial [Belonocnema kinseyi]|uniref:uncharacterized protein LOC117174579 n=1 Tax=Belonocnema kinseyi TaxID=2817044 RepID=UPI00143DC91D